MPQVHNPLPSSWLSRAGYGRLLAFLLIVTFLLKVVLIGQYGMNYNYGSDDRGYLESARILAEEGRFTYNDPERPTLFITPALPGVLTVLYKLTVGGAAWEQAFRILQAAMVSAALYVLFLIGRRIFGEDRIPFWAVLWSSFYPPLWLMSLFIFTESLFLLFLLLLVWAGYRAMERPAAGRAVQFGLLWAAAVYVRPTIALWPGIVFLICLYGRLVPWRRLVRCGLISGIVFALCLSPWWVRNYKVTGGELIPLTEAGGNPLLLGTYPFTVPALFLEEQRTWHTTNDLRVNDAQDTERALERIKTGFREEPLTYISWYTVGKFALFWGDVFYWMALPGIPLAAAILYHYVLLVPGFIGLYRSRHNRETWLLGGLFAYMSLLHMVYLAHSRYSVPLMPLMALFAAGTLIPTIRSESKGVIHHE